MANMNQTIEYRFKPDGKILTEYLNDRSRVSFIMGALGSGKTTASCQKLLKIMCEQEPNKHGIRPTRFFAIRNTYTDLMNTTIKDWLAMADGLGKFNKGGMSPPTHYIDFYLSDGTRVISEVIFLALDRPDSIRKLRGTQPTGFWLNETKELVRDVIDMCDGRHGRYPTIATGGVECTWHGMIGDTNAPDETSWYYELAERIKPTGWKFFKQPPALINKGSAENPEWILNSDAENTKWNPDYYLSMVNGKTPDWINVNILNNYGFVKSGRLVYPSYRDDVHCVEVGVMQSIPIYRGWDFGLTPACVFMQITPTGRLNIIDEMAVTGEVMGISRFATDVLLHSGRYYPNHEFIDIADPAGNMRSQGDERSCFQIMRGMGIDVTGGEQDPYLRNESVRYALDNVIDGKPILQLSPKCNMLRKGFMGGYHYRRLNTANEQYQEKPNKTDESHAHDALQYPCTRLFGGVVKGNKPVEQQYTPYKPQRMLM